VFAFSSIRYGGRNVVKAKKETYLLEIYLFSFSTSTLFPEGAVPNAKSKIVKKIISK
jgi:hypothetical protein